MDFSPVPWSADWICAPGHLRVPSGSGRVFYFGRKFLLPDVETHDASVHSSDATSGDKTSRRGSGPVLAAEVYATALGVYRLAINGTHVNMGEQSPGWTPYEERLLFQEAEVGRLLRPGDNVIVVILGDGWWSGNIGWFGRNNYGEHTAFSLQMSVLDGGGVRHLVTTDSSWRAALGRVAESDLLMGESQDLRLPDMEQTCLALRAETSVPVQIEEPPKALLSPRLHPPVRTLVEWPGVWVWSQTPTATANGVGSEGPEQHLGPDQRQIGERYPFVRSSPFSFDRSSHVQPREWRDNSGERLGPATGHHSLIVDFGRHMTGRVRLAVGGNRETVVSVRHAEALNPDGTLYTANLRTAKQADTYVLSGADSETLVPRFPLHGFRFAEIATDGGEIDIQTIVAQEIRTDLKTVGTFWSKDCLLNELQECVLRSLTSNFVDIPVDCMQRDERLGWTGDINLVAETALLNLDCKDFLVSWLRSLVLGQRSDGAIPDIAPYFDSPLPPRDIGIGQPGWGDAIVGIPWHVYLHTGDRAVLSEFWPSMCRWIHHLVNAQPGFLRDNGRYGDWNHLGPSIPPSMVGTYWFGRTVSTMESVAALLDYKEDQEHYHNLHESILDAFQTSFIDERGRVKGDSQSAYAFALDGGFVPEPLLNSCVDNFLETLEATEWHLSTGFVGTSLIFPLLSRFGRSELAYKILRQTTFPSYGFMLSCGASSLWEHWDSWRPGEGFHDPSMNSFNHYALGSVGSWFYQYAAGIRVSPNFPGYQHIVFCPQVDPTVGSLKAALHVASGVVRSEWVVQDKEVILTVEVPPGSTGELDVPLMLDPSRSTTPSSLRTARPGVQLQPGRHSFTFPLN